MDAAAFVRSPEDPASPAVMTLKDQLTDDMKAAMKGGDKDRLRVIRLVLADIKRVEVDTRKELDNPALLAIVEKAVKQRRDSVEQFTKGCLLYTSDAADE